MIRFVIYGVRFTRACVWFLSVICCLSSTLCEAQTQTSKQKKETLQKQMQALQDEIKTIEAALKKTSAKKEKNMAEIMSLQAKIKSRERLIGNMQDQIGNLEEDIDETQEEIDSKTVKVNSEKREYADMLRKTYSNHALQNQATFVLASSSFHEMWKRYNYLLRVADYRRMKAKELQQHIVELEAKKSEMEATKHKKENLLSQQTALKVEMESEKKEKDAMAKDLGEKESRLRKRVQEKNKAARDLNSKIQGIIEEEIRAAKKKAEDAARAAGKTKPANNGTGKPAKEEPIPMTPEDIALSKNFISNQGKLPWPVTRGHILSRFGKMEHPILKGIYIENNGVDIRTTPDADARSVFNGTVVSVFTLPTTHYCVIIKHGEYFTVYANLQSVSVKANQVIAAKQAIGKAFNDSDEKLTKVHLEIWRGKDKLDPQLWLASMLPQ